MKAKFLIASIIAVCAIGYNVAHAEEVDSVDNGIVTLSDGTQLQSYGDVYVGDEVSPTSDNDDDQTYVDDNTGADLELY